jgi:hypothetical protein
VLAERGPDNCAVSLSIVFSGLLSGLVGRMLGSITMNHLTTEAAALDQKARTWRRQTEAQMNPVEEWHRIVMTQDASGLNGLLADDAVFHSPVIHTPQRGREVVTRYLSAALRVFFNPSFRCIRRIVGPSDGLYEFETEIDGVLINAVDLLKWDDAGRVVEFKVMVRPLKAINLTQQRMGAMLESMHEDALT